MNQKTKSYILAIIACLFWSSAFATIKISYRYSTPIHVAGLRFMLAGLFAFMFSSNYKQNIIQAWKHKKIILTISLFQTFGLYTLFHLGISMVSASITALLIGAGPLFIAILAHFVNGEKFTRRKTVSIIVGFSGIAIIALGRFGGLLHADVNLLGIVLLLTANISGSYGNILIAKHKIPVHPIFQNSMQLFLGGLGIFILSLFVEDASWGIKPLEFYISIGWLGIIASVGFSLWFVVLNMPGVKVSEINLWKFIIPVFGAFLAWLLLPDEKPELIVILGMILVGMSLVVMFYKTKNQRLTK
jgi:drug/metabolite transporter (DMT)-like permease